MVPKLDHSSKMLRQIAPRNLLSFGPNTVPLELESLNVLIGPNGAGKSNLLEAIALMRATTGDMRSVIRQGGGVREWLWKGEKDALASIELVSGNPKGKRALRHRLSFREEQQGFQLDDERLEDATTGPGETSPYSYYQFNHGKSVIASLENGMRELARGSVDPGLSILAQRRDPDMYPALSSMAELYESIRIYREWAFGNNTVFREPQKADMRNERLEEDFSNLGLFLNRLRRFPAAKTKILEGLRDLYDGVTDFDVIVEGGTVQVFFTEGDFVIPASRLSDGTLRYLCLLAILCDPTPPSLICIEEPELGLHPDILPKLADLMQEASQKMQLIVTTHSDILVDAMSERPESVVVCEKHDGMTEMLRIDREELVEWLKSYRLGQLWIKGQIGGTRW